MDIRARVLLKRSGRPQTGDYLVAPEACGCASGDEGAPCPLLPPLAAFACRRPRVATLNPFTRDAAGPVPHADNGTAAAKERPATEGLVGTPTQHKPGNGFARSEGPYISLPLPPESATDSQLLPLRAVRELAMQEVEAAYLKRLVTSSHGDFQRALTISGLSRARLYDLLSKHSMSISVMREA
ncbi:MAG: hypothetical protein Q8R89_05480 [Desulfomicrobium sp.]|nr:hypothetical protein [Desulfomicrobium sp.]